MDNNNNAYSVRQALEAVKLYILATLGHPHPPFMTTPSQHLGDDDNDDGGAGHCYIVE